MAKPRSRFQLFWIGIMIFSLGISLFLTGLVPLASAADDSLSINSVLLYSADGDLDANNIIDINDAIELLVVVNNTDGGCVAAGTEVAVDLSAYGLGAAESLTCTADHGGIGDNFTGSFTVADAGAIDGIDVAADDDASRVTVTVTDSDENDGSGNPNPTMQSNAFSYPVDTIAPEISDAAISVLDTDTGLYNTFKIGDTVVFNIDITVDSISDLATARADFSDFDDNAESNPILMSDADCGGASDDNILEACWEIAPGINDKTTANAIVTAVDDAGNSYTLINSDNYKIDNIYPALDAVANPITFLKQDENEPANLTRFWYFYEDGTPDVVYQRIFAEVEADNATLQNLKVCFKSILTDDQTEDGLCSLADFDEDPGYWYDFTTYEGAGSYFYENGLVSWPAGTGGYSMNIYLQDNAGNEVMIEDPDQVFVALFGINPIDFDPGLDNATTTDWSEIDDFTAVSGLTFSYEAEAVELGRIVLNSILDLTDETTANNLSDLLDLIDVSGEVIRINSDLLPALNSSASIMMQMPDTVRPGLAVKDNAGAILGYVPSDVGEIYTVGGHNFSSIAFDGGTGVFTFDVDGFSEFDSDNTAPTITSSSPSDGGTRVKNASIILNFSETVDTGSFSITDSAIGTGSYDYSWSNDDSTLSISHDAWEANASVTLTINVDDPVGNSMAETVITFTAKNASSGGGGSVTTISTTPTLDLTKPSGGENWVTGESRNIIWSIGGAGIRTVDIEYSADGGANWISVAANLSASDSTYTWTLPEPSLKAKIRVTGYDSGKAVLSQDTSGILAIASLNEEEQQQLQEEADAAAGITRDAEGRRWASLSGEDGLSPFTGLPEPLSAVEPGWFVRGENYETMYLITEEGTRRPFWNATTFFTWADSWDEVIWVTDATLATMPLGQAMLPQPGVVLVKIQSDQRVYMVEENSTTGAYELRWITTEAIAVAMFGENWADYVIDVDATMFAHYSIGDDVTFVEEVDRSILKTREEVSQ
ncbi:Ig-like domain-containing protein [Patescibacteria group bacterium]|nr:Ig-like domain-containing protein [Patescibacteria group bacterium]